MQSLMRCVSCTQLPQLPGRHASLHHHHHLPEAMVLHAANTREMRRGMTMLVVPARLAFRPPSMLALVVLLPLLGAAVPSLLAGPSPAARSRPSGSSSASTRYMAVLMACRATGG